MDFKTKSTASKKLSKTTISDTENELLRPNPFYKKCAFWHHQECVASFLPMVNQAKINDAKKETNTLFEGKRHVVYEKTTRCLRENDTLFEGKQHVVLEKTTRGFKENDTLFWEKRHVVLVKTTRRL